ncbi:STAS domain-containing protein [Nonomuraea jiangxiensis]|uniref:Anti-anti-sigma factor n=1 Tax=Nonomuraea jiangxiensis TaxID=633440 RepID=A0A1G8TMY5_9ACTN|nr:STAS domain-containing protein [Nonomuraea jiangxiensis]SDJ42956.1 anti-anti-sigma factor [Nonomuraea jiangxiensis]
MMGLVLDAWRLLDVVLVAVEGEVDATNAEQLESFLQARCRPGEHVVLYLGAMTFLDCRGLAVLLRTEAFTRRHGAQLHLAAVQEVPLRVLELASVHCALNIHADVQQAIDAISAPQDRRPSERGQV